MPLSRVLNKSTIGENLAHSIQNQATSNRKHQFSRKCDLATARVSREKKLASSTVSQTLENHRRERANHEHSMHKRHPNTTEMTASTGQGKSIT
jgi:hypothetical protein